MQAFVAVINTRSFDGEETVQVHLQEVYASVVRPVKQLRNFEKMQLRKGKTVTFTISYDDFKFYTNDRKLVAEPGDFNVSISGYSRDVQQAAFKLV